MHVWPLFLQFFHQAWRSHVVWPRFEHPWSINKVPVQTEERVINDEISQVVIWGSGNTSAHKWAKSLRQHLRTLSDFLVCKFDQRKTRGLDQMCKFSTDLKT